MHELKRIALDPGDVHVGYAYDPGGSDPIIAAEWTPEECIENLVQMATRDEIEEIIFEEFVLYPSEYANQTWSPMKTSQLIGMIKLIARWFQIPWIEQSATIKKPTRRQLSARGIRQVGSGSHARDAELHLYYRIKRGAAT